ncbi:hypothetical protein ACP_3218 [Acidobacterium capsulatum ATCC 51196]|uniref:Uncharacterized protein n=2 Tax=Acidobacteriaceae TaxID=204434 RepID=C1F5N7_ACIC5|nr:hypothetical protein ACP_3218 [Acidobacterium capsulatum ATCC 51196]
MAAAAAAEHADDRVADRFSLDAAEERLMQELDRMPAPEKKRSPGKLVWGLAAGVVVAGALGALWGMHLPVRRANPASSMEAHNTPPAPMPAPRAASVQKTAQPEPLIEEAEAKKSDELSKQLKASKTRYAQLSVTAKETQQQLAELQAQEQQISNERDALQQELAQAQAQIQTLKTASATMTSAVQNQNLRLADLQTTVDVLNSSLNEKNRLLALDKQFLAHDRQIRNLIAARNLYIADIYDVKDNGETAKPFGRIFYTKNTSLVFYGYDLDKHVRRNKLVSFQAWGSGNDQPEVSLGLFSKDGKQKCWILHFNNTKTLARLNKVFVTVEPQGGSNKPTGKQILMAYLRIQPNHP